MKLKTIKIVDNDISITTGATDLLTDLEAMAQIIKNELRLWLGSWWKDTTLGLNWLNLLEEGDTDRIKIAMLRVLRKDPRVVKVQNLTLAVDRQTRACTGSFIIQTTIGQISGSI
jgi:hypothetical protein